MTAELLTIIEDDGQVVQGRDPHLSDDDLKTLYRTMVAARHLEERRLELQEQDLLPHVAGDVRVQVGQEATQVGSGFALSDWDWVFPTPGQLGIPLLRDVSFDTVVDQWFGNVEDTAKGRQGPNGSTFREANTVASSAARGTQISHATGAAMAGKMRGEDTAFLAFVDEGETSSSDFHAGMNFAAVYRAPVIVLCLNSGEPIAHTGAAYGMPGLRVDGRDVLAVYRATKQAVERARTGDGPTLIEAFVPAVSGSSASSSTGTDPIQRFQRYLLQRGLWNRDFETGLRTEIHDAIDSAIQQAKEKPAPGLETLIEDVYMNPTQQHREQLQELQQLSSPDEASEVGSTPL